MLEKDIENLIAKYPDEFFPEDGFKLRGQQVKLGRCFADIIFYDKHGRAVIVEVKRGILSRDASGQAMEYYGLLKQEKPTEIIELILCANVIPAERRLFLERAGIECKEMGASLIADVAQKYGYKFLDEKKEPGSPEARPGETRYPALISNGNEPRNVWIFQANPERYDILNALNDPEFEKDTWLVTRHKDKIKKSDLALIWMSGKDAGIYAIAEVITDPAFMFDDPKSEKYWLEEEDRGKQRLRVVLKTITQFCNNPIFRRDLKQIEGLKNMKILRFAQGTNFPVTGVEWEIIKKTFINQISR